MGSELFHAKERRTDLTKQVATFSNFVKAPKSCMHHRRFLTDNIDNDRALTKTD